tara:strand:+ start:1000 stop:1560 length:561 start_codon:yes stop_codon:yes gene_type:complete
MIQINLVTSNLGKVKEFKHILEPDIKVDHIELEYNEIRSDSNELIALQSAEALAKQLNKTVVVEDSGLFITALKDFPGTCSSYIHKRIGLQGILKLLENQIHREAYYKSSVAICKPKNKPLSFNGEEKGSISNKIRGHYGFGHDPIFIPYNSRNTYGELENCVEKKRFRKNAILKLKEFILKENAK